LPAGFGAGLQRKLPQLNFIILIVTLTDYSERKVYQLQQVKRWNRVSSDEMFNY